MINYTTGLNDLGFVKLLIHPTSNTSHDLLTLGLLNYSPVLATFITEITGSFWESVQSSLIDICQQARRTRFSFFSYYVGS